MLSVCVTIAGQLFYLVSSGKGSLTPSHFSLLLCACALSYFRFTKTKRESVSKFLYPFAFGSRLLQLSVITLRRVLQEFYEYAMGTLF